MSRHWSLGHPGFTGPTGRVPIQWVVEYRVVHLWNSDLVVSEIPSSFRVRFLRNCQPWSFQWVTSVDGVSDSRSRSGRLKIGSRGDGSEHRSRFLREEHPDVGGTHIPRLCLQGRDGLDDTPVDSPVSGPATDRSDGDREYLGSSLGRISSPVSGGTENGPRSTVDTVLPFSTEVPTGDRTPSHHDGGDRVGERWKKRSSESISRSWSRRRGLRSTRSASRRPGQRS